MIINTFNMRYRETELPLLERERTYALRGLCMILILAHHIYQHVFTDVPYAVGLTMTSIGWLATGMFLFLSGYGLFFSLRKNQPIGFKYSKDRLLKILKPFLFGFLVFLIYDVSVGSFEIGYYVKCLFTLTMPTTVSWFLKVIFCLYILTFVVFSTKFKEETKLILVAGACFIYFCIANFTLDSYWYESVLNFPVGMYFAKHKDTFSRMPKHIWIGLLVIFFISFKICLISSHLWFIPNIIFSLLFVYLFAVVNISNKVLAFIGTYSLCFYLYEMHPLFWLDQICINPWLYGLGVYAIATILTLLYVQIDKLIKF